MIDLSKIQNSHLLTDIFDSFPSFHDSEVHQFNLVRGATRDFSPMITALIQVFEVTSQIDEQRFYVLKNHVLVKFRFSTVSEVKVTNFNYQNVLQSLEIKEVSEATGGTTKFEILFEGIFGMSAKFYCEEIVIESVEPFSPKDKPYA